MNSDIKLKSEALWVLCNAISTANSDDLVSVILKYRSTNGKISLMAPLIHNLSKL